MSTTLNSVIVLLLTGVPGLFIGCGDQETRHPDQLGTIELDIASESSSNRLFVLCQGHFGIQRLDASGTWTVNAADHTAEATVKQQLPRGSYRMSLSDWQLCEMTGAGTLPIDARLVSSAQIDFQIYPLQSTYVTFTFLVQDLTVVFGGDVVVQINVQEGSIGGYAGAGGQGGAGGYSGGGSAGSPGVYALYDACVASCMQETATAYYSTTGVAGASGVSLISCAHHVSASCSTTCSYEMGGSSRSAPTTCYWRYPVSCCPDAYYEYFVCSASGTWTCEQTSSGSYTPRPPAGCPSEPSNCSNHWPQN